LDGVFGEAKVTTPEKKCVSTSAARGAVRNEMPSASELVYAVVAARERGWADFLAVYRPSCELWRGAGDCCGHTDRFGVAGWTLTVAGCGRCDEDAEVGTNNGVQSVRTGPDNIVHSAIKALQRSCMSYYLFPASEMNRASLYASGMPRGSEAGSGALPCPFDSIGQSPAET
jgi:hypothetical protein